MSPQHEKGCATSAAEVQGQSGLQCEAFLVLEKKKMGVGCGCIINIKSIAYTMNSRKAECGAGGRCARKAL